MIGSKTALTVGSIATAFLFGGGLYLYMNFNMIAKRVAEHVASETLGVDVNIGSLNISVQNKRVEATNIRIANPPGYKNAEAIKIGSLSIQAETLSQEMLNFSKANLKDMHVNLEVTPAGTNLTDIQKHISVPGRADKAEQDKKTLTKVILREFAAEGGTLTPSISMLKTQPQTLTIPPLHLKGIGESENGVMAGQAISQIFKAVSEASIKAAHEQGLLKGLSGDILKDIGVSPIERAKEAIKEKAGSAADKVKSLFQ